MQHAETIESEIAVREDESLDIETDDSSDDDEEVGLYLEQYDVSVVANDFNVATLCSYLSAGTLSIPGFQRGYVWDKKKASRFIESLLLGLPVPQVFLFEKSRNDLWVIDGQQRLMSIYFFSEGRFPRSSGKATRLRSTVVAGKLADLPLEDNKLFSNFLLDLKSDAGSSPLHGKSIEQIEGEGKFSFSLYPFRSMVVKQHRPDNHQVAYEMFHRLNTGGKNLTSQQIRNCVYESKFIEMVRELNLDRKWRKILGHENPVATQRDEEIIMRSFALLKDRVHYAPSLARFLNQFAERMKKASEEDIVFLRTIFQYFVSACESARENIFLSSRGAFRVSLFEAVFVALFSDCVLNRRLPENEITLPIDAIRGVLNDENYEKTLKGGSARRDNVDLRLSVARRFVPQI